MFSSFYVNPFQLGELNSSLGVLKSSYTLEITLQPHLDSLGSQLYFICLLFVVCSNCRHRKLKWNEKNLYAYGRIVLVKIVEVEIEGVINEFKDE